MPLRLLFSLLLCTGLLAACTPADDAQQAGKQAVSASEIEAEEAATPYQDGSQFEPPQEAASESASAAR